MSKQEIFLFWKKRIYNWLRTLFYLLLLYYLMIEVFVIIFGEEARQMGIFFILFGMLFFYKIPVSYIMRMYGARPIEYWEAPFLYQQTERLFHHSGLEDTKFVLYYLPMNELNALTLGGSREVGIALTQGLLKYLNEEEITSVLAHEIAHIKNNDLLFMNLATHFSKLTYILSSLAQFFILLYFPLFLFLGIRISLRKLFLLFFAPWISFLLQSALSRTREFEADLTAVEILGDASGLISALRKIDYYNKHFLKGLWQALRIPEMSLLSTHPPTEERIKEIEVFQLKNKYYFPA